MGRMLEVRFFNKSSYIIYIYIYQYGTYYAEYYHLVRLWGQGFRRLDFSVRNTVVLYTLREGEILAVVVCHQY